MNGAIDISYTSLLLSLILLALPLIIAAFFKIKIIGPTLIAVLRMVVQLLLIAVLLRIIFDLNKPLLTLAWFIVMVLVGTVTVINKSDLSVRLLLVPGFLSLFAAALPILIFFTALIIQTDQVFEARYFIAIGGMLLGNSLRANIVGLTAFYKTVKRDEERYLYHLSTGASSWEALRPYFRRSLRDAFAPTIATVATMGIVFLPGMMTGQIIGGSAPIVAVKYQIAVMLAISASILISTGLCILLTMPFSFNSYGLLKSGVFRKT